MHPEPRPRRQVAPRDRATFEALDATICNNLGRMVDSVACTRRGAALVDADLPTDPAEIVAAVGVEIGAIMTEQNTRRSCRCRYGSRSTW